MRVFFDTNVMIAAFISHGLCNELFDYCLAEHTICTSDGVLAELSSNLQGKFGYTKARADQVIALIRRNAVVIIADALPSPVSRDPNDDPILAASAYGNVDCLITGDQDLLVLKHFRNIPILKPNDFWKFEREKKPAATR